MTDLASKPRVASLSKGMNSGEDRIYLSPPHMSEEGYEQTFVKEAFTSNWIAPIGPHVNALEEEFSRMNGSGYSAAVSTGTAALHLALRLIGIERGDEVLCSSFTFCASANPIIYQGGVPVFVDSSPDTWNMNPALLEEELHRCARLGKLPKAVIVVDLYGQCADWEKITDTCRVFDIPVIEDAAEALGATYHGRRSGNFGAFGVFSFNGNKIITGSGGGMLVSDDPELIARARTLSTQARLPVAHYEHDEIGYNYRMSNVIAGIVRGQLRVLSRRIARKRQIGDRYRKLLSGLPGLTFMPEASYGASNHWLTCTMLDENLFGATPEQVRLKLEQFNIESRPLWKPLHLQPIFRGFRQVGGEVSERLFAQGLCLPSGTAMTDEEIERIAAIVSSCAR